MMKKKYMKQVGHADAQMFFYVDSAEELAAKIGGNAKVSCVRNHTIVTFLKTAYGCPQRSAWRFLTGLCMVKMIHLKL